MVIVQKNKFFQNREELGTTIGNEGQMNMWFIF